MKNKLTDLNDHLFAQLERLSNENLSGDKLKEEIDRTKAISSVASGIINNGRLVVEAQLAFRDARITKEKPAFLGIEGKGKE